ncbi:N-acetylneuraminate epimerase [Anaerobiospirillum sp. NML120448]|uniref:N-acetylneuraminate epimerase n=1 Tax=Anaerobiospirillum sp. NML120448 TaxID=2932816 RepID=UPI001FF44965|nr:N-acetylneuraminate epimerase [Anaerobiospirillum sp. NML120448]MCK0515421.1 N-acetylneuraminate epimerase [Anaerobiospirillum sp. NML120448]
MKIKHLAAALALGAMATTSAFAAALPDVPVPFKSGAGAMNDGVIYIGLGTAGQDWYKLDTKAESPKWEAIAKFPEAARDQAQAVALNNKIYVFGGVGKINSDILSVSNEVFEYDPATDTWTKLLTRSPIGLTGHTVVSADGKNAIVIGSVNKEIFDGFFKDLDYAAKAGDKDLSAKINADYISKPVKDYFFNKAVLQYDPQTNLWSNLGDLPYFGTAGSAVAVDPQDQSVFVVNGERKPGLRTSTTVEFTVENGAAKFVQTPDLIPAKGEKVQEGVAGAFSGYSNGTLVVIGGANFPGSTVAYAKGKNFAHEGCTKTWRDEIFTYANGAWTHAGDLATPLAYGVSIQNGDELILVGGETTGGKATTDVITVSVQDGKVVTE